MKLKVLYTAFDLLPSPKGAGTHITYFTRGLVNGGYDVTLITAGDPALPPKETYNGATLLRVPAGDDLNFLKRAVAFGHYTLAHVNNGHAYHLVHFRSIWSGFPLAEAKGQFKHKLLYEVNGLPSIEMKYHYPALRNTAVLDKIKEQETATLHLADAIICPSAVTAAYITSLGVAPDKITVIPNGIDTTRFHPNVEPAANVAGPEASTLQPFTLAPRPVLLYIGTLADWQGLVTLIEAMPLVLEQQVVQLHVIGLGRKQQRKLLQKRVRKLGLDNFVSIKGAIPHRRIPAQIARASICVAPLGYNDRNVTQGCCPLKILEYMGCGKPIVASNLPVVRELVGDGKEALLFTPDDSRDLAQKILRVLNDRPLAANLGANATARVHRQFTWSAAQQRLLEVYESLLS